MAMSETSTRFLFRRLAIKLGSGLEYNGGNSPSSGLVSVLLGMQMCKKVDVYGFSLRVSLHPPPPPTQLTHLLFCP